MSKATFSVDGLHCWGCVGTVEKSIHTIPDVRSVIVDLNMKGVSTVTVEADHALKAEEIQRALDSEGNFTVV
ncbi:heavy-metal-associated domain-containing protein [Nocardia sp. CDC159]|uniref:Heavy-metal-associated domain-containing protein n=1 Tax=Nocardia pulmonis TaxID=2951408 RepID=A0A9X2E9G5_9NOCA|nr:MULTISPECIES: heavy metal-associated domain-containing protein [Nocardia]MCM6776759.1 heavy-metal-associated domain-containing protein [Nocardia pulmonis]MCM6789092.1 heavy-metal-associated domain-containing protein [Nocardia sp. CDC159]